MRERREDLVIIEATRNWLQNSCHSQADFATNMLAPNIEEQEPALAEDYLKWHQNITQRVSCVMNQKQPLPLKWKWPWIASLPLEVRKAIESELAAMSGYLHTMPVLKGADAVTAKTSEIYTNFASLVKTSNASHDGVYDPNDDVDIANQQVDATLDLIATLVEDVKRLHLGTGATGKVRNINQLDETLGGLCTQSSKEKR